MAGKRFELRLQWGAAGFELRVDAAWDAPVAALFGPSGSGKTSVLECVAGLRGGIRGRVRLGERVLLDSRAGIDCAASRRRIGWVPQDASLFPHLTVRGNVEYGAAARDGTASEAMRNAIRVLEIEALMDRPVQGLSGGEQRRVALARALASRPDLLMLDEPMAGLDVPLRSRVFPYLLKLRDELSIPMLYVSHDPAEVWALAGHVVVLQGGRQVAEGDPREVLWSPGTLSIVESLGVENRFLATEMETGDPCGTRHLRLPGGSTLTMVNRSREEGTTLRIGIRAADIVLCKGAPQSVFSTQNILEGEVTTVKQAGCSSMVRVRVNDDDFVAQVTDRAVETLGLAPGARVHLLIKAHSVHPV